MTPELSGRPAELLLVEDSEGDVRLMQEALKQGRFFSRLHVVGDGEEALQYLRRQGKYSQARRPDLVLLDLNLPRKDGRQVLAEAKGDPELRSIPMLVLTNSKAPQDVEKTYMLGANCYISKPVDWDAFLGVVSALQDFWFRHATLPSD
jgi:CheY-like chemotaxis protein